VSRWRALAAVREIPDAELRDRLVDATETLFYVAKELDVSPNDTAISNALDELKGQLRSDSDAEADEIVGLQADLRAAEERTRSVDRLEEERDTLRAECDDLRKRLDAAKPLIDAYADAVSFARRFVSVGERAGVELRFCKGVPGRGKPSNANAARRAAKKKI
jgi:predicted nuclease with TOPRIM domain